MSDFLMYAAARRYRKERDAFDRCSRRVRELNAVGDKSSKERRQLETRLWKLEMRLSGMRSMAKAVGLDVPELERAAIAVVRPNA